MLISGAWHSGNAYDTLLPFLHDFGYTTTALTLQSVGAIPLLTTLEPEVEFVRSDIIQLLDQARML